MYRKLSVLTHYYSWVQSHSKPCENYGRHVTQKVSEYCKSCNFRHRQDQKVVRQNLL